MHFKDCFTFLVKEFSSQHDRISEGRSLNKLADDSWKVPFISGIDSRGATLERRLGLDIQARRFYCKLRDEHS